MLFSGRAPSDAEVVTCWKCRALTEEASKLRVKPSALRAWRSNLWSRFGWGILIAVIAGALIGLFGMGAAMVCRADIGRIVEIAFGSWLTSTALACLVACGIVWDKALTELRKLQAERDEARRLS